MLIANPTDFQKPVNIAVEQSSLEETSKLLFNPFPSKGFVKVLGCSLLFSRTAGSEAFSRPSLRISNGMEFPAFYQLCESNHTLWPVAWKVHVCVFLARNITRTTPNFVILDRIRR